MKIKIIKIIVFILLGIVLIASGMFVRKIILNKQMIESGVVFIGKDLSELNMGNIEWKALQKHIEQELDKDTYFMFEEDGQKYLVYIEVVSRSNPHYPTIESFYVKTRGYDLKKRIVANVDMSVSEKSHWDETNNPISYFGTVEDYKCVIIKVDNDCSGIVCNGIEINEFQGI